MNAVKVSEHDVLSYLRPDTLIGALAYFVLAIVLGMLLSRLLRRGVHASMVLSGHIDRTTISFLQQFGTVLIWVIVLILYAHLIPVLRSMGTALLAGASVASVVIGLAAQSTLGNLVAGISITIYKPFRLGDTLQVFLTKVEAGAVTLELRLLAEDVAGRDLLRSRMLATLAQRFADAKLGASGSEAPTFA
jgi:small conductance mechanosensitive channel